MSTQAGSSEVSKKLKAAIRAKLEELGVYVDDELPDYIMVMIANKKEKVQMKDDLSLFIGKSTAKFVDWLFDLFDRLQNASAKQGESSKKEDDKKKETEARELEERQRKEKDEKEKELQREKERENEKEKEKERQRERDREKRLEEEKRRAEKRKDAQRTKRRRSRSNTYSDDEERFQSRKGKDSDRQRDRERGHRDHRARSAERKRVASTVVHVPAESPERQKVHSTVTVKRNIRPTGESSTVVKGRGSMFLKALNEASVSAGYGPSKAREEKQEAEEEDDDMSDVDALPSKSTTSPRKSIRERLSRVTGASFKNETVPDDDAVVLNNQPQTGGPQMILKLSGGKEAIKRTRIQDRIVVDDNLRRGLLKRKVEATGEPKSKHERIIFDLASKASRDSTPSDDSPTMRKWDGQIKLTDDSDSEDEEAEIDAFVAEARSIVRHDSIREEEDELPPTHQLSGTSFANLHGHGYQQNVPAYIPTPLSVLQEQQNQLIPAKEDHHVKERCVFWPKCTKGDACAFMHPAKPCTNFPNCTFGSRCLFIHPPCRYDRFCTKKHCPFTHHGTGGIQTTHAPELANPLTSNRFPAKTFIPTKTFDELPKPAARGALGSLAEKLAASLKKKSIEKNGEKPDEKTDENVKAASPEIKKESSEKEDLLQTKDASKAEVRIAPLQTLIPCRFAGGCRNPVCHFKHPKECRFGANCRNPSCYFYHKPSAPIAAPVIAVGGESASAKYKWTASS